MKRIILIMVALIGIMAGSPVEAKTTKSTKGKTTKSTTSKKSSSTPKYTFQKTSDGYVSPIGHTYVAKDGPVSISLQFQDEDTLYFVYNDSGYVTKRYFEWEQNGSRLILYGDDTMVGTLSKNGMQFTSDGIVFNITN